MVLLEILSHDFDYHCLDESLNQHLRTLTTVTDSLPIKRFEASILRVEITHPKWLQAPCCAFEYRKLLS